MAKYIEFPYNLKKTIHKIKNHKNHYDNGFYLNYIFSLSFPIMKCDKYKELYDYLKDKYHFENGIICNEFVTYCGLLDENGDLIIFTSEKYKRRKHRKNRHTIYNFYKIDSSFLEAFRNESNLRVRLYQHFSTFKLQFIKKQ